MQENAISGNRGAPRGKRRTEEWLSGDIAGGRSVMRKQIASMAVLAFCIGSLLTGGVRTAYAKETPKEGPFSGEVGMLKQENGNYVMQVTAENQGEDFTGTVQVIFNASGYGNCAYNTELTLPSQGKKQFTVTVPGQATETQRGLCVVNFLDGKGKLLQSIPLENVFGNAISGIPTGILSDHYSDLTYLDAGGCNLSIGNMSYPMNLIELDRDNLEAYLEGLYFLVIDSFNVESLGEENIQAIQEWVKNGGWLLIGTGEYAEQTLSGFDEDFLDVEVLEISEPWEENDVSANADRYGYYYNYVDAGIDLANMAIAKLEYPAPHNAVSYDYESNENPAFLCLCGDGAVAIYFCSFVEKELQKLEDYAILHMYDEIMYQSDSYSSYNGYSDMDYVGQRSLAFIDSQNTDVDFTWLEVLIGIYVVLVGPILYLVLRKCRKREWYWLCAPALGLIFIGGVFLFGRGARVNETRVYSVTVQQVDANRAATNFLAYHSGVKPWKIRLQDAYDVAGPGWNRYYLGYSTSIDEYYYMVDNDPESLSIGIKPQGNFDSGFLYAEKKTESQGKISGKGIKGSGLGGTVSGTVTNETDHDMAYMAVWLDTYVMVFSDVKAGETIDLYQDALDGRCVYQSSVNYFDSLLYDMVSIYGYYGNLDYEQDDMAALLIGLGTAIGEKPMDGRYAVITGVVKDYDKAVAGKCKETAYGCLYSYAEMGGDQDAAD